MLPSIPGMTGGMGGATITRDADFYIHELFPINFFGSTVYITTTHVCTIIIMVALMIFALAARRSVLKAEREHKMTTFSTLVELGVDALNKFVSGTMGERVAGKYANYIGVLALYIFFSNTSGIFGLRPPTADYGTTLCLALITFIMIEYADIRYNKWGVVKGLFEPVFFFLQLDFLQLDIFVAAGIGQCLIEVDTDRIGGLKGQLLQAQRVFCRSGGTLASHLDHFIPTR